MTVSLEQDISAYDRHYVTENRLTLEWYPKRVVAQANTGNMLELGLGHGYSTQYFSEAFDHYTVIEGSSKMIERYLKKNSAGKINFVHSFFEDFKSDFQYDAIGMGFILEHVDNPADIVRQFSQFLTPDGSMFIAVPNAESLHRRIGHEAGLLADMTELSDADRDFGHQRYFTRESLCQLVEAQGLKIHNMEGLLLKPFTTNQISQLDLDPQVFQALLKVGVEYPELSNSILLTAKLP